MLTSFALIACCAVSQQEATNSPADLFLFQPAIHPIGNWKRDDLNFDDVWFDAVDGTRLNGWYFPAKAQKGVILHMHGNAGNITHRANMAAFLQRNGYSTLIFDYRGYGRSKGIPSQSGVISDARTARTKVAKLANVNQSDVVLLGRSMGGAVAVQLAAEAPPTALILQSTFTSLKDVARIVAPQLAFLVGPDEFNSIGAIKKYKGPLLLSHGNRDRLIPFKQATALFEAANDPKAFVRIDGGGHNSPQGEVYFRKFFKFLERAAAER